MKNKKKLEACSPTCSPTQICMGTVCGCPGGTSLCPDGVTCAAPGKCPNTCVGQQTCSDSTCCPTTETCCPNGTGIANCCSSGSNGQICLGGACGCAGGEVGCPDNKTCCNAGETCCLTYNGTVCCPSGNECVNNACATCGGQNCTGAEPICYKGACYPAGQCFADNTICCAADQIFCNGACCTGQCLNNGATCCAAGLSYCQGGCNTCCGATAYNPTNLTCCGGQLYGAGTGICCENIWTKKGSSCCGSTGCVPQIPGSTPSCCNGACCTGGTGTSACDATQGCCPMGAWCGTTVGSKKCCNFMETCESDGSCYNPNAGCYPPCSYPNFCANGHCISGPGAE